MNLVIMYAPFLYGRQRLRVILVWTNFGMDVKIDVFLIFIYPTFIVLTHLHANVSTRDDDI